MNKIRAYLELIRFSHTLFALPFAVLSAAMAVALNGRLPSIFEVLGFFGCMIFARSAAMAFNRWTDRYIDGANPRTALRHIPSGILSPNAVLFFTIFCSVGFIASCALFLPNPMPIIFSVPVLLWLFGYSFTKRFTILSHFWLGIALMLAPIAAWVALRCIWHPAPVLLGLSVLFWTAGFDILYACQDAEFDKKNALHSIPERFGVKKAMRIAMLCHITMLVFLFALPLTFPLFYPYFYIGVVLSCVLIMTEHWIVRPKKSGEQIDLKNINAAFFYVNVIISFVILVNGLLLL